EPLDTPGALGPQPPALDSQRSEYIDLLHRHFKAPDGSYEEGFVPSQPETPRANRSPAATNLELNNPLSLHNEATTGHNPWTDWFASVEQRKVISQDVERTFPEIPFFHDATVQKQLTAILYIYSAQNPSIGYRQGMHELLAVIYYVVHYDSITAEQQGVDAPIKDLCARNWVAADAWALFGTLMKGAARWYEWREPQLQNQTVDAAVRLKNGQLQLEPYVSPVVSDCDRIQSSFLRAVDPRLWQEMKGTGIEPQLYGARWLRLLFTREFGFTDDTMRLWDGLFAQDPTLKLALWVCVAMLIRVRSYLISADYTAQLTTLLRYPSPTEVDASHSHTVLLFQQAVTLQVSPAASTGVALAIQNRNILHIPLEVVEAPESGPITRPSQRAIAQHRQLMHARNASYNIPDLIPRGLMDRGEGINKTLMGAVNELKKTIPDFAASLVRSPNNSSGVFPLDDDWVVLSDQRKLESEIAELKATNKRLGRSLDWI
ncbi:RabGAP/TBC, partial [Fistulina hepatica ATCC 64428]